jgi:hypothetical protein
MYLHLLRASTEGVQPFVVHDLIFCYPPIDIKVFHMVVPSGFPLTVLFKDFTVVVFPIKEECKDRK